MSALSVPCPTCGASVGQRCHYSGCTTITQNFHSPRWEAGYNVVTPAEARHVLFYYGQEGGEEPGGFVHSLLLAISRADADNLTRLRQGFPGYVAAMKDWHPEDLKARLREDVLPGLSDPHADPTATPMSAEANVKYRPIETRTIDPSLREDQ